MSEELKQLLNENNRIELPIANGHKFVCERSIDPEYPNEFFVGIEDKDGVWIQDFAIIRQRYNYNENGEVEYDDDNFEILVFGDDENEDYTDKFNIALRKD